MKMNKIIKENKEEILRIAKKYGAKNLEIFGSVVQGTDKPDSDIDILLDLEAGRTLLDHAALMCELEELLGRKVDIVTRKGIKKRIRERVFREAVPLCETTDCFWKIF